MKLGSRFLLVAALLLGATSAAHAQATIIVQGRVTGTADEPISEARVTATDQETGQVRVSGTAASGSYVLVGLQPGQYVVRVQKLGFRPVERQIELLVGQRANLDFTLQDAAV